MAFRAVNTYRASAHGATKPQLGWARHCSSSAAPKSCRRVMRTPQSHIRDPDPGQPCELFAPHTQWSEQQKAVGEGKCISQYSGYSRGEVIVQRYNFHGLGWKEPLRSFHPTPAMAATLPLSLVLQAPSNLPWTLPWIQGQPQQL